MVHFTNEMGNFSNGNSNGNGAQNLVRQPPQRVLRVEAVALPQDIKGTRVVFKTHEDVELRGALVRTNRLTVIFELYNPIIVPRISEVLEEFKIIFQERAVYAGRAIVHNAMDAGTKIVVEAALDESTWSDGPPDLLGKCDEQIVYQFKAFLNEWQKLYNVSPEFKLVIADMQTFLQDLRIWLDQVEVVIQSQPAQEREELERKVLGALHEPAISALVALFEKFEQTAKKIEKEFQITHSLYAKNALHPLVLCAPFMHRTFEKPLGYAGDYEMVNMMTRNPFEGGSIYAKILNAYFLETAPVVAHRNRIDNLVKYLSEEVLRAAKNGRRAKIFNLGCGPAAEIQKFLLDVKWSSLADFTLLDFNDETVAFTGQALSQIRNQNGRETGLDIFKKSVAQLLKDSSKFKPDSYDLVYCAGLFDYMPDNICTRLLEVFYKLTAPGGLVLVTNVDTCNPSRCWMEYMVDWLLVYRNATKMRQIMPSEIAGDIVRVFSELSSVNVFAEIRKPQNG
jgi:extracellular factor (EF) 3-hydroxypalmitic acid methyl ester biosynthesis protein